MNYGTQLYDHGFLKYADPTKLDTLKTALIDSFDIYEDDNNKIVHIDAEELAECSFEFFMTDLNRILKKRGFELNVRTADNYEATCNILINGNSIQLYREAELADHTFWESAPSNFFKEINRQLSAAKISESFYLLYGGNDLHAMLLTESQYEIIAEKYSGNSKECPYAP